MKITFTMVTVVWVVAHKTSSLWGCVYLSTLDIFPFHLSNLTSEQYSVFNEYPTQILDKIGKKLGKLITKLQMLALIIHKYNSEYATSIEHTLEK